MTLRDEIDRRRLDLGLSVYRLAKLAAVNYGNLCGWLLHGRANMGEKNLDKLRAALELEEVKGLGKPGAQAPQPKGEPT